jgi:phosphate-selective porin OprO and OprP
MTHIRFWESTRFSSALAKTISLPAKTLFKITQTNLSGLTKYYFIFIISCFFIQTGHSQTTNDVLNLLIQKGAITQDEADSLRSEAAIKQQETDAKRKSFPVNAGKSLLISGFTQVRYQNQEQSGKKSGFDIRRARLDFRANISPYFGFRLLPEFAGASARILDGYAEVKLADYFNLTIGQQKVALSRENQESDNKYDFLDRSQVVTALVARGNDVIGDHNGRDIGIQANGSLFVLGNHPLIEYWIGIFNGAGINASENNTSKDASARLLLHPVAGLDIGGSYYDGVGKYGTTAVNHGRTRWGVELRYELQGFFIQGEYLKGKDNPDTKYGYYGEAAYYILPQKLQVLARYDVYEPNKAKNNDVSTVYTGGINYNFNSTTRLLLTYNAKKKEGGSSNSNYAVAQFLIGF